MADLEKGTVTRVSVTDTGKQVQGPSYAYSMSADGALVLFGSSASNLISGETIPGQHLYIHDTRTNQNTLVDVNPSGDPGHLAASSGCCAVASGGGEISANGKYVAFVSTDDDLVQGDTNQAPDVFIRDLTTGKTERVSVSSSGEQAAPGAFPDTESVFPSVSDDGRWVAFDSSADNLAPDSDPNGFSLFVRDRLSGTTRVVDKNAQSGIVSSSGRFVFYQTVATYLWDTTEQSAIQVDPSGESTEIDLMDLSNDAAHLVWAEDLRGDESFNDQVVALDRGTSRHRAIETTSYITGGNLVMSGDGATVAFATSSSSRLAIHRQFGDLFIEVCSVLTGSCRVVSDPK